MALKDAAEIMMQPYGSARLGAVVLALSALFSTGSAINATLFSAAHFAKGMLSEDLLPDQIGASDADGIPERTVLLLGGSPRRSPGSAASERSPPSPRWRSSWCSG